MEDTTEIKDYKSLDILLNIKLCLENLISEDRILSAKYLGICGNLDDHPYQDKSLGWDAYDVGCDNSYDWELFSGISTDPIERDWGYSNWEGTNLEKRISLMKHILNKVDKQIELLNKQED